MTRRRDRAYTGPVDDLRSRAPRWIIAGLGALLLACAAAAAPGLADTSSFDVGDQAVVVVQIAGRGNSLVVRTWDRSSVAVESEVAPAVERRTVTFGTERMPLAAPIPPMPYALREGGQIVGQGMLPPEDFPYAAFRPGPHDVVKVTAEAGARLVVTIPASTGILQTRIGGGHTSIEGYRGANLFILQNFGRVELSGATTTAFVQMNNGALSATDGTFDRLRVRVNTAHVVFEHCRSKQIEANSVSGAILYDGGSFDPGLARFESLSGNIALGVTAPAQLAGRSQDGHVYTQFERAGTAISQPSDGTTTAAYGGGGPLVNAISGHGNVYLYDGSLTSRRVTAPEWRPVLQLFSVHRRVAPSEKAAKPHALREMRRIREPGRG
ncbi:MAG: hypothetical protein JWN27_3498 [Candidatus Eremiobacteraeota bacterium]|nr:hypothetical protein [Candidatus Eremiobacteraeota bacterium]